MVAAITVFDPTRFDLSLVALYLFVVVVVVVFVVVFFMVLTVCIL